MAKTVSLHSINKLEKFSSISEKKLAKFKGGKIIRISNWSYYDTKTQKYYADNQAIAGTLGTTMVNGWATSFHL